MIIGITGHTSGIGKTIFEMYPNSIGFSRSNGFDLKYNIDSIVEACKDCDVVIYNAHDGFEQVNFLYELTKSLSNLIKIINISSNSSDGIKNRRQIYSVEKAALDKASEQLFYLGYNVTNLRIGLTDTPRVNMPEWEDKEKMEPEYVVRLIDWIIKQPYRVKEICVQP